MISFNPIGGSKMKLKKAKELYPDYDFSAWFGPYDYSPIYKSFGTVVRKDDIGEYQGDTQVLLYDAETDKHGYLMFGWGSCSMCDRLQGCKNYKEVDDLIQYLYSTIRWFDDDEEGYRFFTTHTWHFDYAHSPEFVSFCTEFFKKRCGK